MLRRCLVTLLVFGATVLHADSTAPFDSFFTELEAHLSAVTLSEELQSPREPGAAELLQASLDEREYIHTLLQMDARGRVVNEVVRDGTPGRKFRNVGRQTFFSSVMKENEPYYAYVKPRGEPLLLFWAFPVSPGGEAQTAKPAGVLAAKLDLGQCLAQAAQSVDLGLAIIREDDTLFAQGLEETDSVFHGALVVKGVDSLGLVHEPPPVVQQDTVTDLGEDDDSVAALDADLAMGGGAAAPVQPLPPTLEQVVSRWLTVLGVLVLVLLVALVFLVRHVQRRRREQIMRELEKKTGVMKVPRRPPTTVIRARSGTGATPVQTRTPLPPPGTVMPPPTDRPPSPPRTPPPTRTPSPSAPPPTAGDAGVPEEVYQRIRKQVYEDLREEVMQEMANERRKMFARAEVFTRTVETYVNDLTKHIAETETSWNDLSASIKNTAFRLKQALEGFEQQHNGS